MPLPPLPHGAARIFDHFSNLKTYFNTMLNETEMVEKSLDWCVALQRALGDGGMHGMGPWRVSGLALAALQNPDAACASSHVLLLHNTRT